MDRRLLFPAIAVTALAQQVSPATAEAEKAVRARAQKFLQLEQDKNFRAAWALVAEDTQDYFFNTGRPEIQSFTIDGVELSDDNTRARVTFRVKRTMPIPGMGGQTFELGGASTWKFENGDWFWYVDQSGTIDSPFGKIPISAGAASGRCAPDAGHSQSRYAEGPGDDRQECRHSFGRLADADRGNLKSYARPSHD